MRRRRVLTCEQPEVLTRELAGAMVIDDQSLPVTDAPAGVPHGVTTAKVRMRNVRVEGRRRIFFCQSHDYRVLQSTLQGADAGSQPPEWASDISASRFLLPRDGYYDVDARVSINGARHVHIEQFYTPTESPQPVSVG